MGKRVIVAFALLLLLIAFSKCKKMHLADVNVQSVILHKCTSKSAQGHICFDSLLEDSRCPRGAVCVWSGTALIGVTFHETSRAHSFVMSLKGFPSLGYPADTAINGYRIIFTNLEPYPDLNSPGPRKLAKKASFTITR